MNVVLILQTPLFFPVFGCPLLLDLDDAVIGGFGHMGDGLANARKSVLAKRGKGIIRLIVLVSALLCLDDAWRRVLCPGVPSSIETEQRGGVIGMLECVEHNCCKISEERSRICSFCLDPVILRSVSALGSLSNLTWSRYQTQRSPRPYAYCGSCVVSDCAGC